jgi:hypothetical protein
MWNDLSALLAKLPTRAPVSDWSACLADLDRYQQYGDDWDGQGASAIPGALVASARELALALRARGVPAPDAVLPGFEGTVALEWDAVAGGSVALEVTAPGCAELECRHADPRIAARVDPWQPGAEAQQVG